MTSQPNDYQRGFEDGQQQIINEILRTMHIIRKESRNIPEADLPARIILAKVYNRLSSTVGKEVL